MKKIILIAGIFILTIIACQMWIKSKLDPMNLIPAVPEIKNRAQELEDEYESIAEQIRNRKIKDIDIDIRNP